MADSDSETDGIAVKTEQIDFAEDLGRLLGTAQTKAQGWLSQRQALAHQLEQIRDTASSLLSELTGAGAKVLRAVERGRKRGRPAGSNTTAGKRGPGQPSMNDSAKKGAKTKTGRRGGMSPEGRARVAAAQKARWAAIKAQKG